MHGNIIERFSCAWARPLRSSTNMNADAKSHTAKRPFRGNDDSTRKPSVMPSHSKGLRKARFTVLNRLPMWWNYIKSRRSFPAVSAGGRHRATSSFMPGDQQFDLALRHYVKPQAYTYRRDGRQKPQNDFPVVTCRRRHSGKSNPGHVVAQSGAASGRKPGEDDRIIGSRVEGDVVHGSGEDVCRPGRRLRGA